MFSYNPEDASSVFAKGEYDAVLKKVTEKTSKAGNAMLEVNWTLYDGERQTGLFDYIVNPATIYKLKQIAKAMGKLADFEGKTFDLAAHVESTIRVAVDVEEQDGFDDKNVVKKYLPKANGTPTQAKRAEDPDIPF